LLAARRIPRARHFRNFGRLRLVVDVSDDGIDYRVVLDLAVLVHLLLRSRGRLGARAVDEVLLVEERRHLRARAGGYPAHHPARRPILRLLRGDFLERRPHFRNPLLLETLDAMTAQQPSDSTRRIPESRRGASGKFVSLAWQR